MGRRLKYSVMGAVTTTLGEYRCNSTAAEPMCADVAHLHLLDLIGATLNSFFNRMAMSATTVPQAIVPLIRCAMRSTSKLAKKKRVAGTP
mmetsp:Transcript_28142/g.34139  ORF Transcript_28142/g.34139 Transcript_28142/m.34139 type:complete len:90 (-) Transcript_28142:447-716(-)